MELLQEKVKQLYEEVGTARRALLQGAHARLLGKRDELLSELRERGKVG